jgi:hypothetical protein
MVEIDARYLGIGAVLSQDQPHVANHSGKGVLQEKALLALPTRYYARQDPSGSSLHLLDSACA